MEGGLFRVGEGMWLASREVEQEAAHTEWQWHNPQRFYAHSSRQTNVNDLFRYLRMRLNAMNLGMKTKATYVKLHN